MSSVERLLVALLAELRRPPPDAPLTPAGPSCIIPPVPRTARLTPSPEPRNEDLQRH